MNDKTFIFLPDAHIGYEPIHNSQNGWAQVPAHDVNCLRRIFAFAKDFKPDVLIFGGDQFHFDYLSRWTKDSNIGKINNAIETDLKLLERLLVKPAVELGCEIVWMLGNHDIRIRNLSAKHPEIGSMLNTIPKNIPNFSICEQGEILKMGKLHFIHGDTINSRTPAKTAVERYGVNIRLGHFHCYQAYTLCRQAEPFKPITGVVVPAACHRNPAYLHKTPNQWAQGFAYGCVSKTGNFNDYVVIDSKGFNVWGKDYK